MGGVISCCCKNIITLDTRVHSSTIIFYLICFAYFLYSNSYIYITMQCMNYNSKLAIDTDSCSRRKLVLSAEEQIDIEFNSFEIPPFSSADKNVFIGTLE